MLNTLLKCKIPIKKHKENKYNFKIHFSRQKFKRLTLKREVTIGKYRPNLKRLALLPNSFSTSLVFNNTFKRITANPFYLAVPIIFLLYVFKNFTVTKDNGKETQWRKYENLAPKRET